MLVITPTSWCLTHVENQISIFLSNHWIAYLSPLKIIGYKALLQCKEERKMKKILWIGFELRADSTPVAMYLNYHNPFWVRAHVGFCVAKRYAIHDCRLISLVFTMYHILRLLSPSSAFSPVFRMRKKRRICMRLVPCRSHWYSLWMAASLIDSEWASDTLTAHAFYSLSHIRTQTHIWCSQRVSSISLSHIFFFTEWLKRNVFTFVIKRTFWCAAWWW